MRLARLPRLRMAALPTPLQPAPRLSKELGVDVLLGAYEGVRLGLPRTNTASTFVSAGNGRSRNRFLGWPVEAKRIGSRREA
jgi:hypothetical protein